MKTLQELTLLDRFLFDQTMEDTETYEALLRIILGDEELKLLTPSQTEKELRTAPWLRSIRVDVFAMDDFSIYNTEMQKEWRNDLVKRSRYYQALIDSSLLEPGVPNYNNMKNTTIIMITPFDLFGQKHFVYTFEDVCIDDPTLKLNDGAKRIFINTHGTNVDDVSPEFIALMKFIEYNEGIDKTGTKAPNLEKIVDRVGQVKASEKVGVLYMQKWEEEIIMKQQAEKEGFDNGFKRGMEQGMKQERLESIRNVVKGFNVTAEKAMESLGIPESDYDKYLSRL
ncbi:MAG: Rpn family recombination-promoting nuclease/putative transposase [Lachnospiraceae bacterium]|nr:Rpn family recombination-promoting nuclease/putative transposase [Lachnospiraceae bacterium]